MKLVRSKCPSQSASTPGTAAIASTLASPSAVSICGITIVRSCKRGDLGDDIAALVVVVREAERRAAPARRRIARARDDVRGFVGRADHRHHDADRADVERARDEVIFAARHAHHRHDAEAPAQRELGLERLEAEPRVLHVVEHEFRAGVAADLRHAGRKELEDHRAERASRPPQAWS